MGTARNYKSAFNSFSMFRQGKDLPFVAITEEIIEEYNSFLTGRGVSRNTISFYMRTMRAVYNKAVRERLVEQTYPFRNVYTGIDRTRKRAVDESVISKLLGLDLMKSRSLEMARDLFLFSFYTRGMAFVDIVLLKKTDICNGLSATSAARPGSIFISAWNLV